MRFGYGYMLPRRRWPGGGDDPPVPPSNAITSLRGADTKANAGGVNLGALLPEPMVATTSSYTVLEGNAAHWTLPVDGKHPVPTSAGVSARLNGGPYVIAYEISDGDRTVSDTLTIERDLGRTRRALDWMARSGVQTRPEKSFTTKCFSVSTQAELTALSASDMNGATILMATGASWGAFSIIYRTLANGCLVTPEDITNPPAAMQYLSNAGTNVEFYRVKARSSRSGMTAAGISTFNQVYLNTGAIGSCYIDCDFSGEGDNAADWPDHRVGVTNTTGGLLFIGNKFYKYRQFSLTSCYGTDDADPGAVFSQNIFDRIGADAFFIGSGSAGQVCHQFIFDRNIATRLIWDGSTIHPDFFQFVTTGTLPSFRNFFMFGNRFITADSTCSGNLGPFTGSGSAVPVNGYFVVLGNLGTAVTGYGIGSVHNVDFSGAEEVIISANDSRRAQNGVKGASNPAATAGGALGQAACASGAQGHMTHLPDGTTPYGYIAGNERHFPGHLYDFPAGSNVIYDRNITHGKAPTIAGCAVLDGWHLGRTANTTPPDYTNPNSIEPLWVGQRADPGRVLTWEDWSALDAEAVALLDEEMYAPLPTANMIVRGDGTVNGALCVPHGEARPKLSKYRLTELSATYEAGTLTASLSVSVCEDVICDVLSGGDVVGTITIPAGETSAADEFGAGPFTIRNDSGLVNPAVA